MKRYILIFCLFLFSSAFAQTSINNYKYVIVPERFSFLKEADQYSLNSMTKQLLENKGFTVFFDNNELPAEIANNKCQVLSADVAEKSNMFTTKLTLTLKDCRGNIVFTSKVGTSREKDYNTGYNLALRDAFSSLDQVSYTYNGSNGNVNQTAAATTVVPTPSSVTVKPAAATVPPVTPVVQPATNQEGKTLYAQAIPNGYQLIDTTPKKVLTILKTSSENYFIASNDTVNGIVLKVNDEWFFEYYNNGKLVSEKLLVKF
ncbi:hypothetical protein C8P68_101838 [Mucilaginibacter yixingensis]|uniref:Uncharacterized protein n=1 Tax=Mucilaginibacter yixingensis TaxID=1295612 RepID=A0A2T5JGN4_9SPHI|nr:hypothetical protein [Mucilaginibacter yixingensis]PTR01602.1 hypothetical protein C8P68_101838 [Mucilaginibacter yixingensis]